ncbi:helix-turn-helix transcriptional regulator [Variovorax sp. LT2P21]|uniref:helix-turn-helix transcriptional regulator n=1 Tax=Variovorax sp. LT2P21 TaxID=3443731 RepID=UPI003F44D873
MRSWQAAPASDRRTQVLTELISHIGSPRFGTAVLDRLQDLVPAASWSVYRLGQRPALFLSAARGVPDTTRDCWRAYLSGPHRGDRSFAQTSNAADHAPLLCHLTAHEVPEEHRMKVYEAHGVAERVSIAQTQDDGGVFAINFYRHGHQRAFSDAVLDSFGTLAPALLALVRKHMALSPPYGPSAADASAHDMEGRLRSLCPALTERERAVCVRLLQGMTQDGIASDLGLALPTVKTYRNRAFARLGIHFRNELFARVLAG